MQRQCRYCLSIYDEGLNGLDDDCKLSIQRGSVGYDYWFCSGKCLYAALQDWMTFINIP